MRPPRSLRVLRPLIAVLFLSTANHAQTARPPAAQNSATTIEGRVVADDTGLPIPNARVSTTSGVNGSMPIVLTDGEGRFVFSFPPGPYNISAVKTGYARREVPPPAAGQPVEIRLRHGAAISGRVIDEFGDPVAGVRVALETPPDGSRDSRPVTATTSNDLGEYRFGGLQDGVFLPLVVTTGPPQQVRVDDNVFVTNMPLRTYFPGVTNAADAQPIELDAGETRDGIDFLLTARQAIEQPFAVDRFLLMPPPNVGPAPRGDGLIRGQITGTDGRGVPRASIVLMPLTNPTNRPSLPHVTRSGSDGRFEFGELAPGRFRVLVSKGGYLSITGDGPTIDLAAAEIRDRVQIALTRFGTINGRVLDESGFPVMSARVQALHIRYGGGRRKLVAASIPDALADDRGMFRLYFLEPGQYIVSALIDGVSSEDVPGYARTYFPGVAVAGEAQFVSIEPGQDLAGLDIPLS